MSSKLNFVSVLFMLLKVLLSMFDTFYVTKYRCDTISEQRQFIIENDDFKMSRTDAYLLLFLLKQLVWKAHFWHGCQEITFGIK